MKRNRTHASKSLYSSDRPIRIKGEDVLKRSKFAIQLADDISSWRGEDSLVVALYGRWGSGKSSVKNMVLETISRKRGAKVAVLEFNPWQLSGRGNIAAIFFRDLGIILGNEGSPKDRKKRIAKLKVYSGLLSLGATITGSVGVIRTAMAGPDGSAFIAAAAGMRKSASVAQSGAEALAAKDDLENKGLHEIKEELSVLMAALPRPILVVFDDMDRLTHEEIRQIVQLAKANADFPNLIFLLLFERNVVASALDSITGDKGFEFLEKIIQVGFHIPHVPPATIRKILFDGLNAQLGNQMVAKRWSKHRWDDLFLDGIAGYFRNLRHVKRFLASFTFHVQQHLTSSGFEVNPVDLIGLETLRVFEPAVYERIPGAKTILTRDAGPFPIGEIKQDVINEALSQILSQASDQTMARVIIECLFPPVAPGYAGRDNVSASRHEWLRDGRVCHPSLFDKYFTLYVADDDLSQNELDALISLAGNTEEFTLVCEALRSRGLLLTTFERLDAYKEHLPLEHMTSLIRGLCDLSDNFPEKEPGLFSVDILTYASRLCYFGLRREPDKGRRAQALREAISKSKGIALPLTLISLDDRVGGRKARDHEFLLDAQDIGALKQICVEKFRKAFTAGTIADSPQLRLSLLRWGGWEDPNITKQVVESMIKTSADAVWLITLLLGEGHSYGREHRVSYSISLGSLERYIDLRILENLIEKVSVEKLSKRQKIAIREFGKALKRRAEGKPDLIDHTHDDPDEEIVE
jgi:KAP family P-loop domain